MTPRRTPQDVYKTRPPSMRDRARQSVEVEVKGAEFHPTITETIRVLGGGWYCGTYGVMYKRQPAVRAVVDFLARNIAQLNAKAYIRVGNNDRVEVPDHPLVDLLRRPNPVTTRFAHMRNTVADLAIYDRAYWRKLRIGRSLAVVRIPPDRLLIEFDQTTGRRVYRLPDGSIVPLAELVRFVGYSPDADDEGVSPLETLRRVLQEEMASQQHRENMWRNSARQSGWIERPLEAPAWSDTARQRFRADVEGTMAGGSNAGRIGVLEEGMTWNGSAFSPKDTEYIAGRRLTYEEVAVVYGIDPSIFGLGQATKSSAEQKHLEVYQDVLGPWLRMFQDEFELQLLPDFEPAGSSIYVEFNIGEKLKGSFEQQATTLTTAVGAPWMTPNEARSRNNLPRVDDDRFDMPIMPMNVIYGGQPAPTIPTEVPGGPSTAAIGPGRTKGAPRAARDRRDAAAKAHTDFFRHYFERQQRTVLSAKAQADRERWDRELSADLYALAQQTARVSGRAAAQQLRGVYREPQTLPYLSENARVAAESINAETFGSLDELDDDTDPNDVFETAKTSRADRLGLGRATMLIAFARTEAAKQSQAADGRERTKTWVVTSGVKSRHPELNGETVPVSENFSNGLAWPGDGSRGSAADVAGCTCLLRLD